MPDDINERFDLSDVVPVRARESEDDHELDDLVAELASSFSRHRRDR